MRRFLTAFRASKRSPLLQVAKSALAIVASWVIASLLLGTEAPIFAAIAALLVVAPSVNQSLLKGIERSIGVIIGVVVAIGINVALGTDSWAVLIAVCVALLLGWLLKFTTGASNQIAISAMLVLVLGATSETYELERILETIIGSVVALIINALIVPPLEIEPARDQLKLLGGELAASLERLATALVVPQSNASLTSLLLEARLLKPMQAKAESLIDNGIETLMLNPRGRPRRDQLSAMESLLDDKLTPITLQVTGMTRAFVDQYDDDVPNEPTAAAIAEECRRAAHDIRLAVHLAEVDTAPMTSAIPALTAPLQVKPPGASHWVLFGSLMEDLRRIRHELVEDDTDEDDTDEDDDERDGDS